MAGGAFDISPDSWLRAHRGTVGFDMAAGPDFMSMPDGVYRQLWLMYWYPVARLTTLLALR